MRQGPKPSNPRHGEGLQEVKCCEYGAFRETYGADRERRRIRRAQREALVLLVRLFDNTENRLLHDVLVKAHGCLDTATRAPRKGKR